ncbi:MAG: hypothetical protein GY870_10330 [archaeon]|nr:hypothetical protein [archaeon]
MAEELASNQNPKSSDSSNLWVLKYKPKIIDEIAGRDDIIQQFKNMSKNNNISHMMFSGPKGYGKITMAILASKEILGDSFGTNFKIVYAGDPISSEERDEVNRHSYISKTKVGSMAGRKFTWPAFLFSRIKPFVEIKPIGDKPFKILLIRDFHLLQNEQQGFRRLMEKYSASCRMILLTDEISSIIDPILSRCRIFFFQKIDFDSFADTLNTIAEKEGLVFKGSIPKMLYLATEGKLGDSINILQKISLTKKTIGRTEIYKSVSSKSKLELRILTRLILQERIEESQKCVKKLKDMGLNFKEIITGLSEEIYNLPIDRINKAGLLNVIGDIDFESCDGFDEEIQFNNFLYQIVGIAKNAKKMGV